VGPYREKEASYYTYKRIFSPVQVGLTNLATFNGTLAVSNRFDFTDLSQCSFNWQLGWFPDAQDPTNLFSPDPLTGGVLVGLDSGTFTISSVPPQTTGLLGLPSFPANWTNYDVLRLTASDPFGNNIYTWTLPLRTPSQIRDRILGQPSQTAAPITAGSGGSEIVVTNGPRVFHFSNTSGLLNSLTVSNQTVSFNTGPTLVVGAGWGVSSITNYFDGNNYVVLVNNITNAANGFQWTLRPDGWLNLTYRFTIFSGQSWMGITFNYPSNNVSSINWIGQGPYRVYKNRLAGQEVFAHTKSFNFGWTGQSLSYAQAHGTPSAISQWAYPEFQGYHGQLYWASLQTTEQPITIVTAATNLFLRLLTPPVQDIANVAPAYPSGTISILNGITPIGNKFDAASATGPAGQNNVGMGLYTNEVNFFFGQLPASDADRDGNGLTDSWELKYFNAVGQNPNADLDGDGLPLILENAFDLSPTNADASSPRLPHFVPGTVSPAALAYQVPLTEVDAFTYTPQISSNLVTWIGADDHPEYFLVSSNLGSADIAFSVEPNLAAWPGVADELFLRLKIARKH
jgi:hypothetical protein